MTRKVLITGFIFLTLLAMPGMALADGPTAESNAVALDTVWTLLAAFLVFFMQAGFAMVEAGFTRALPSPISPVHALFIIVDTTSSTISLGITTSTLILIIAFVITSLTYPVVGHWIWGGGWLSNMGFIDLAGSTVVHSVGGWSALVTAYFLGSRIGNMIKKEKLMPFQVTVFH